MQQQLIYREKVKAGKSGKAIGLSHVLGTKWRFPRHEGSNQKGPQALQDGKGKRRCCGSNKLSKDRIFITLAAPKMECASVNKI